MTQQLSMEFYQQRAEELNALFNGYLDKVSQEKGIPKQQAFEEFFQMVRDAASKTPSVDFERVSSIPPSGFERVNEVPRVAVLRETSDISSLETLMKDVSLKDSRCIKSFKGVSTQRGIEAMDFMIRSGSLSKEEILEIHNFLIHDPNALREFLTLNGESPDAQNAQFELFLSIMNLNILNYSGKNLISEILNFAFSPIRFEWIQLQDMDINPVFHRQLLDYESSIRSKDIRNDIATLETSDPGSYDAWMRARMGGSSTITTSSSVQQDAQNQWLKAEEKMATKAQASGKVSFDTVRVIHATLTAKDGDVQNPGEVRNRRAKSSLAHQEYPTHCHNLDEKAQGYGLWLDTQLKSCERGDKSVILTAAQAYQRLVSIHPFENGNGRISRLMMDFVLERFGLPPAALGKNVLDAVYALDSKKPEAGEAFVLKVFQGVQTSHKTINGK
ncbi:MAG: Fic family protein [Simkania sp.]|nr:Fic family protein [Simkania sp.]